MKNMLKIGLVLVLALGVFAGVLSAQEMGNLPQATEMAGQSLRPYAHVFIAYAIAIVAVLGWVISMTRRLAGLEARLSD